MEISKYAGLFHDGSLIDIQHIADKITLSMKSAEIDEDDIHDEIILSKDDRIQGKLHLGGIKKITFDDQIFRGKLTKHYDKGRIFDFEMTKNSARLAIIWINFPPKPEVDEFSVITLEAEKFWWENIPNIKYFY